MEYVATPTGIDFEVLPERNDVAVEDRVEVPPRNIAGGFTLHIHRRFSEPQGERIFPLYYIADEPFQMDKRGDMVVLKHDHWSLRGRGHTLIEAELDLIRNAQEDAAYYLSRPVESMTARALALRDFILRVLVL